jgi:two-component system, NtrC family, sensor histidine kinase HydH
LPPMTGDATQLEQAFLNLILNAAEAMPNGGTLTITAKAATTGRAGNRTPLIVVEFRDTGEGMTEEQQKRAFTSLLSTTKRTGTGLGLAIVHRIIEAHHGKLTLRSKRGEGTVIRVLLPQ